MDIKGLKQFGKQFGDNVNYCSHSENHSRQIKNVTHHPSMSWFCNGMHSPSGALTGELLGLSDHPDLRKANNACSFSIEKTEQLKGWVLCQLSQDIMLRYLNLQNESALSYT